MTMEMKPQQFAEWARRLIHVLERNESDETTSSEWDLSLWELQDDNQTCPYLLHPPVFTTCNHADEGSNGNYGKHELLFEDESIFTDEREISVQREAAIVERSTQVQWNFSIVFSDTYRVPVLYFRVQTLDGSPCERSRVLKWLPNQSIADSWDFISQEEHPISGLPSYFLHPCQSSSRLKEILRSTKYSASLLWAWMSMILPAVNYPIPPSFYKYILSKLDGLEGEK